jgi:glucosamine--fructose-6-phosphate aminotransferase (isomerizing)
LEVLKAKLDPFLERKRKTSVRRGIAHTRWATHGAPKVKNAHPIPGDKEGVFAFGLYLVHNGIIENHRELRDSLLKAGHKFTSDTDTEVIVHLIEVHLKAGHDLFEAVRLATKQLVGTYALAVLSSKYPDEIVAARNGSPLLVGLGADGYCVASDQASFAAYAEQLIRLKDGDVVRITSGGYEIKSRDNRKARRAIDPVEIDLQQIKKGKYSHYMLKEIHEQPEVLEDAMRGRIVLDEPEARVQLGGIVGYEDLLRTTKRIIITACGTSFHAALEATYLMRQLVKIPVTAEYASEFRYDPPVIEPDTLVIVISQSGETADTLAALREAKRLGAKVMGITNVVGSTIPQETDFGVYLRVGPEIGVASTKAFTGQLVVLTLFAVYLASLKGAISQREVRSILTELKKIPKMISETLSSKRRAVISRIVRKFKKAKNVLYLGRGINYPVALEGALKAKEISYVHAEGMPAAEMKHGSIALIEDGMPVVVLALDHGPLYTKVKSNMAEVKSRNGCIIVIANDGDVAIRKLATHVLRIPRTRHIILSPLLAVIPMQLFAYLMAVERGCDVDQPRNLAKSVTVE